MYGTQQRELLRYDITTWTKTKIESYLFTFKPERCMVRHWKLHGHQRQILKRRGQFSEGEVIPIYIAPREQTLICLGEKIFVCSSVY